MLQVGIQSPIPHVYLSGVSSVVQVVAIVQLPRAVSNDATELRSTELRCGVFYGDVPRRCGGCVWGKAAHLRGGAIGGNVQSGCPSAEVGRNLTCGDVRVFVKPGLVVRIKTQ